MGIVVCEPVPSCLILGPGAWNVKAWIRKVVGYGFNQVLKRGTDHPLDKTSKMDQDSIF